MNSTERVSHIANSLKLHQSGRALPQAFYVDPDIFDLDIELIFQEQWLAIGLEAEIPKIGSYLSITIGRTPIVILRDKQSRIQGYFNSCRHRGSQICPNGSGVKPRLVCPYHQWVYDLDGKLINAERMPDSFKPKQYSLIPIAVQSVNGVIYICLSKKPPNFEPFKNAIEPFTKSAGLKNVKLAHEYTLVERANWKLVVENARECYHCGVNHRGLSAAFPTEVSTEFSNEDTPTMSRYRELMAKEGLSVGPDDGSWWQIARFPLNEPMVTMSRDGKPLVSKRLTGVRGGDVGCLRFATEPNSFCHVLGDYAFMFFAYPVAPQETHVVAKWYVHEDAEEGVDYCVNELVEIWDETNREDLELVENNQRGVNGKGYVPGPYSHASEGYAMAFTDWYHAEISSYLGSTGTWRSEGVSS